MSAGLATLLYAAALFLAIPACEAFVRPPCGAALHTRFGGARECRSRSSGPIMAVSHAAAEEISNMDEVLVQYPHRNAFVAKVDFCHRSDHSFVLQEWFLASTCDEPVSSIRST